MQHVLIFVCYCAIFFSALTGTLCYKHIDTAMRILVVMLVITTISELSCYIAVSNEKYSIRSSIYHFYNVIQAFLITAYFIYAVKPRNYRFLLVIASLFWPMAGIANVVFFEPLGGLNSNILMLESFAFITMSLHFTYRTLKNDAVINIFRYAHFRMAMIFLFYWSANFFFWAFLKELYSGHWQYMQALLYGQTIIEILIYGCITVTLYYSSKPYSHEAY